MISGIYIIACVANNKIYIGSSNDIYRRWRENKYQLRRNKHTNNYLQNSWNKYGENLFIFEILDECKDNLINNEIFWIKQLKPEYNILSPNSEKNGWSASLETKQKISIGGKGNKNALGHKVSDEAKKRMSSVGRKTTDETKAKLSLINKGKIRTNEQKSKISNSKKGHKVSEETRRKISETLKKKGEIK